MEAKQIKFILQYRTGKSVPQLAKERGVCKDYLYKVLRGLYPNSSLRPWIADIAKKSEQELWPEKEIVSGN